MIDIDKYEGYSEDEWILVDDEYIVMNNKTGNVAKFDSLHVKISQPDMNLMLDAPLLLAEVKRLREESKKKGNVLSTLDEMIRNEENHVEMMKALEQGLDLPETWKEMV